MSETNKGILAVFIVMSAYFFITAVMLASIHGDVGYVRQHAVTAATCTRAQP